MKKTTLVFLSLVLSFVFSTQIFGQQRTQQQGENIVVNTNDLPPSLVQQLKAKQQLQQYGEWAGLGREVGLAINEGLKAVTDQTAEFAKTDVGKFTMFLIAYNVVGEDLLGFMIGIPLFFIGSALIMFSYWRKCMTRRVRIEGALWSSAKKYKVINEGIDNDGYMLMWFHIGAWAFIMIVSCVMMFA